MRDIDADQSLSTIEADQLVRRLSNSRLRVEAHGGGVCLLCGDSLHRVHLPAYQITPAGLAAAVAENDPWPD